LRPVKIGTQDKNRSLQDWQIRFSSPLVKLFCKQPSFPLELKGKEIPRTASEGTVDEVIITPFATFSSPAAFPYERQHFEDFEKNAVLNFEEIEKNHIKYFEETGIYSIFAMLE